MPRPDASAAASAERFLQFSLLGLVASGFLAVAGSGYLDTPTVALTAAGLGVRALMVAGFFAVELSERSVTIVTTAYAGFFLLDFFLLSRGLLPASIHLVFFLAVVKALTAKAGRDYLYLAAIAVVELLAAALLSIDVKFFAALALYLLFGIATLAGAEIRRSIRQAASSAARGGVRRFHARLALLSGFIALGILALTAALFFILPRTADAALSRFARHATLTGFAEQVTLGQAGGIGNNSRPLMHIRIFSSEPPGDVKWRGAALSDFDGRRWSNPDPRTTRIPVENGHADLGEDVYTRGRHLEYHVDFDAADVNALFFAGTPVKVDVRCSYLVRADGGAYSPDFRPRQGFHYDAYSAIAGPPESAPPLYPPPILPLREREKYLQLPAGLDPRIPALARSMAGPAATDLERARALENRLRRDYRYTLRPVDRDAADPLADFLFAHREGHCEYFASALAVELRTLGVPARIVTGFDGGEYNSITDLWVVRASDAHSWVEAWIPGFGWSTFDATPSTSDAPSFAFLTRLGLYLDAAQTFWRDWVMGYGVGRQDALADRLEQGARRAGIGWTGAIAAMKSGWDSAAAALSRRALLSIAAAAALVVWIWLLAPRLVRRLRMRRRVERARRGQAGVDDATVLYQRMLHILRRQGYQKPPWYTPVEFANSLPTGPMCAAVAEFTTAYNALRFGGRAAAAPRLSVLLDQLERRP